MCILGNIFGGLSSIFLGASVHCRNKKNMVLFQIFDCICAIISCILLKGYNGVIANTVALMRNIIEYKKKTTKLIIGILVAVTLILGLHNFLFVEQTWYALFPVIANVEYTLGLTLCKKYNKCKIMLLINQILWSVYEICILNIASACVGFILCINTIYSIIMSNRSFSDNGLTHFQREKLMFEFKNK